ncbi:MAG TPA: cytochrome d ubiquinol oxidase subunit II [Acidimicrobiales bacterium]|nr:cytochrome d ubiquinol oxidase subunit II [Acidimicrobiales bacterium]
MSGGAGTPGIDDAMAAVLFVGITLYATTGGADFGGGVWDLLAVRDRRGTGPREVIDRSVTAVWEANHVWLVFILVILWTAFPAAFAAVMTTLWIPMVIALFGIVLRGAGFAYRKEVRHLRARQATGIVFASSSLIAPFFFGAAVGGIAAGRVRTGFVTGLVSSWTSGFSILAGALFVAAGAFLSAVYLCTDTTAQGRLELRPYFVRRALAAGLVTGGIALGALFDLASTDARLYDHLTGRAVPLVVVSGLLGVTTLVQLARGCTAGTRPLAAGAVAAVVWGWGWAQYPDLLATSLPLRTGSAPTGTMDALLVVFALAVGLVLPSLGLLYYLATRQELGEDERDVAGAALVGAPQGGPPGQDPGPAGARRHPADGLLGLALAFGAGFTAGRRERPAGRRQGRRATRRRPARRRRR